MKEKENKMRKPSQEDKGVILVPRNLVLPTARFLTEAEQEAYQDAINQYSSRAREVLDIPRKGSNIFKVCLLNQTVLPEGIRTATLSDLGQIVETDKDYLRGVYVDAPAVVLRSAGDYYQPNDFLAKDLAKQIKRKTFPNPVIVTGLKVEKSKDSAYGLRFRKTNQTEVVDASELHNLNDGRRFTKTDERGLPIFDENGSRVLYTRNNGLSRLYLSWGSGLHSCGRGLAGSDSGGRVVVVSNKATSQNLDNYVAKLKAEQERQAAEIQKTFNRAWEGYKRAVRATIPMDP